MTNYKILGQNAPAAGVETSSYIVPATKSTVVRAINVTNTSSTPDEFDISVVAPAPVPTFITMVGGNAFGPPYTYSTDNGITWTQSTMPASSAWQSIIYADGKFVVLGMFLAQAVFTSTDGITWTSRSLSSGYWRSITHGSGTFVAVAYNSATAASSTDGITWTQRTLPTNAGWTAVAYGNGTFVAVAWGGTIAASSTNGITWTQRTLPANAKWISIAYGGNTFIAVSGGQVRGFNDNEKSTIAASSTDGITWTQRTLPVSDNWISVAHGNNTFVAVAASESLSPYSNTNNAASSTDGITWTQRTLPVSSDWSAVTYGNGTFVAVARYNGQGAVAAAASSTDGITWTQSTLPATGWGPALGYGEPNGLPPTSSADYIFKSQEVLGNETITVKGGYTLNSNNAIRVKSTNGTTAFNIFGGEI